MTLWFSGQSTTETTEKCVKSALRKKCPYSDLFWSTFSRIQSEWGKMRTRITPNTDAFYAVLFKVDSTLRSNLFIVNFDEISYLFFVFQLSTLNKLGIVFVLLLYFFNFLVCNHSIHRSGKIDICDKSLNFGFFYCFLLFLEVMIRHDILRKSFI